MLPDIVSGLKHGYKFSLRKGYVFDDSVKIFSGYIDKVFIIKQEEDRFKETKSPRYNPVRRMLSKLIMNCLYGKMSQKPIEDSSVIIKEEGDFRKFVREHDWRDLHEMGNKVVAVGKRKDFSVCVRKPMQLGSYILAYSRTLMTGFMDMIDPVRMNITDHKSLEESWANTYVYGDTDAMHIHSSTLHRLKGVLYDPEVHECKKLGQLDDELEGGKIIEEFAPAPKLYACRYIMPDGSVHEKIRGKGVVSYKLKYEDFPKLCAEEQVSKDIFMMQKYRWNIPKGLQSQGFTPFSIEGRIKTRTLGKTQWQGRLKVGELPKAPKRAPSTEDTERLKHSREKAQARRVKERELLAKGDAEAKGRLEAKRERDRKSTAHRVEKKKNPLLSTAGLTVPHGFDLSLHKK